jgi:hypothetical protein
MPNLVRLIDHIKGPELGVQGATPAEVIGAAEDYLGLQPVAGASLHTRAVAVCSTVGIHFDDEPGTRTVEAVHVTLNTKKEDAPGKVTEPGLLPEPEMVDELHEARKLTRMQTLQNLSNCVDETPILQEIGLPSSKMSLNLDRINRELCGLPDKRSSIGLSEVAAYSAFMDPKVRGKGHAEGPTCSSRGNNVLFGEDAAMMRRALLMTHLIMRHELLPTADMNLLGNLKHMRQRRGRFRSALLKVRPLFFGTASGLNSFVRRRLSHAPVACRVTLFVLNNCLRSYGQVYWCCNPWAGLILFVALWIDDTWMALICLLAVLMCNLTARLLGAAPILLELGLQQLKCITQAQLIAYYNQNTPPQARLEPVAAAKGRCHPPNGRCHPPTSAVSHICLLPYAAGHELGLGEDCQVLGSPRHQQLLGQRHVNRPQRADHPQHKDDRLQPRVFV